MSRFVAGAVALALLAGLLQLSLGNSRAQTPDVDAYRQFIDAMNQGNVTRALAVFSDDAVVSGFPPFCMTDCKGKPAIQRQLEFETGAKINLQMLTTLQQTSPSSYTATISHRADLISAAGLSRVIFKDTVGFSQGKISKLVGDADLSDSQTATFAFLLSQPQPAQAARPAASGITPPSTGDAGLAVED